MGRHSGLDASHKHTHLAMATDLATCGVTGGNANLPH